jgi:hypothetical protein
VATALPDSPRPCFPTDTKSPLRYDIAHRVCSFPSSVVPIIRLPGTPPSLSHNTPRSHFMEERQAMRSIMAVIRSYAGVETRSGADYAMISIMSGW